MVRAKAEAFKRAKGSEVVRFGEGGEEFDKVGRYLGQSGMFAPSVTLILDRPLDDATGKELIFEKGEELVSAGALVIAIIPDITATEEKKLPKGAKVEKFIQKAPAQNAPAPNNFALTDAYQDGDRKKAWVMYRTLINAGSSSEEIHGTLSWAVRGMVLAGKTRSAEEAGMKDYPYRKAKSAGARMGQAKAEEASAELVKLYHDARMGNGELEDLIEVFLLKK